MHVFLFVKRERESLFEYVTEILPDQVSNVDSGPRTSMHKLTDEYIMYAYAYSNSKLKVQ